MTTDTHACLTCGEPRTEGAYCAAHQAAWRRVQDTPTEAFND